MRVIWAPKTAVELTCPVTVRAVPNADEMCEILGNTSAAAVMPLVVS